MNNSENMNTSLDFEVTLFSGETFDGTFSYDPSVITGEGEELARIEDDLGNFELNLDAFGETFTEEDDVDFAEGDPPFPFATFEDGEIQGIDYLPEAEDVGLEGFGGFFIRQSELLFVEEVYFEVAGQGIDPVPVAGFRTELVGIVNYEDQNFNTIAGTDNDDFLEGTDEDDRIFVREGRDRVFALQGDDFVLGGDGDDLIAGGSGDDELQGENDDDILIGDAGDDELQGGDGADLLIGRNGDDILAGDADSDTLVGGAGADRYTYDTGDVFDSRDIGIDSIQGFVVAEDKIVLSLTTFDLINSIAGDGFSVSTDFAVVTNIADASGSESAIVYDSTTGNLFYNQNGLDSGFGEGGQFATFTDIPELSSSDFELI